MVRVRLPDKGKAMQRRFRLSDSLLLLGDWIIANNDATLHTAVVTTSLGKPVCALGDSSDALAATTFDAAGLTHSCTLLVVPGPGPSA